VEHDVVTDQPGTTVSTGAVSAYAVPEDALDPGTGYSWKARAFDGVAYSAYTSGQSMIGPDNCPADYPYGSPDETVAYKTFRKAPTARTSRSRQTCTSRTRCPRAGPRR